MKPEVLMIIAKTNPVQLEPAVEGLGKRIGGGGRNENAVSEVPTMLNYC